MKPHECECKIPSVADQTLTADAPLPLAEGVALRKNLDYYKLLHTLRKKAKLALNLRIRDLRSQLRDEKAKAKDYEHNWHLTCSEVKELRKENERLKVECAEWKRAHDEHDCTATVDVGGEIERLRAKLEEAKQLLYYTIEKLDWYGSEKQDEVAVFLFGLDSTPDKGAPEGSPAYEAWYLENARKIVRGMDVSERLSTLKANDEGLKGKVGKKDVNL